jgi:hypothetical protein
MVALALVVVFGLLVWLGISVYRLKHRNYYDDISSGPRY